jgi:hypothetical protein
MVDAVIPADLDDPLDEAPHFYVEPVSKLCRISEITAAVIFRRMMRTYAPTCQIFANANAGKRNPWMARREGILAGVFDYCITWPIGGIAWVELKGHSKRWRAGKLSDAQIRWGNHAQRHGQKVACFFEPASALAWLRDQGAPVDVNWPGPKAGAHA